MTVAPKQRIPITPLMRLYREVRKMPQADQLERAQDCIERAAEVAGWIGQSIDAFSVYDNRCEPFCPEHPALPRPAEIVGGRSLAQALAHARPSKVDGREGFDFELVEYELPPARTTTNACHFANRFEDGSRSTTTMKVDVVLRHEDGTPVVGEAKVARATGYDSTAFLALIQALAGATQLATPNQLERLSKHYPASFCQPRQLDVFVLAYYPPKRAPAKFQQRLDEAARELTALLNAVAEPLGAIRRIGFIAVSGDPRSLKLHLANGSASC